MADGIENTECVVVFITTLYRDKVNGTDLRDSCHYEFAYAVRQLGPQRMIPVVMEASMSYTTDWRGLLGANLGGLLYVDMAEVNEGTAQFETKVLEIYDRISSMLTHGDTEAKAKAQADSEVKAAAAAATAAANAKTKAEGMEASPIPAPAQVTVPTLVPSRPSLTPPPPRPPLTPSPPRTQPVPLQTQRGSLAPSAPQPQPLTAQGTPAGLKLWTAAEKGDFVAARDLCAKWGDLADVVNWVNPAEVKLDSLRTIVYSTPLLAASVRGYDELVKLLISLPAVDVNKDDLCGYTPLWGAVCNKHLNVVKLLVTSSSIDLNKADKGGRKPIEVSKCEEITAILRIKGAIDGKTLRSSLV
jgi:hypothetical protein